MIREMSRKLGESSEEATVTSLEGLLIRDGVLRSLLTVAYFGLVWRDLCDGSDLGSSW